MNDPVEQMRDLCKEYMALVAQCELRILELQRENEQYARRINELAKQVEALSHGQLADYDDGA